jgi:hypothetical protein
MSSFQNSKISFSQSGEDLIVDFIFKNLFQTSSFTYIDIGAFNPFLFSNTAKFYLEAGNRGINIDANSDSISEFCKHRPDDINLNFGIGEMSGLLKYYMFSGAALNTFSKIEADKYSDQLTGIKEIKVETLPFIISNYCNNIFPDFMSLDVEGSDFEIIKTIDINNSPKVICVETIINTEGNSWEKNWELIDYVKNMGYVHHSDTAINSIFIKKGELNDFQLNFDNLKNL